MTEDIDARLLALMDKGVKPTVAAKQCGVHHSRALRLKKRTLTIEPIKKHLGQANCRVRIKSYNDKPSGYPVRVVYITDSHDSPKISQERFTWFGKFVAETSPDYFIHGGDFATLDSGSSHEKWETISGKNRSPLQLEIDSMNKALDLMMEPIEKANCKAKKVITFGNHEDRVARAENLNPMLEGMLWRQIDDAFLDRGFKTFKFREWFFLEEVGFTHVPLNGMGKRYAENSLLNDATFSMVYGDSHKPVYRNKPKAGYNNAVQIFNSGCSLPHGHVEHYCQLNTTGWGYGIGELYLHNGQIVGHSMIPMLELERRYK